MRDVPPFPIAYTIGTLLSYSNNTISRAHETTELDYEAIMNQESI